MAKGNQIKKVVNGEIADADDVNQIVEDAGSEGGLIPYDPTSHTRSTNGSQSQGSTAYPWGSIFVNRNANLVEVDPATNTAASSVAMSNLRRFLYLKDVPSSYSGQAGKFARVNVAEDALEFALPSNVQLFTGSGTFVAPAGITKVYVSMIGGGGGGGGATASSASGAAGGGAGAFVQAVPFTVVPGNSYTVTIGAAGTGGSFGTGGNGGTTSFDSLSTLGGTGGGGQGANGGVGGVGTGYNASASVSTTSTSPGGYTTTGGNGAKGGTSSGNQSGAGGGSPFGLGAAGRTNDGIGNSPVANSGAGGSGAIGFTSGGGTTFAGGNGGAGVVIVAY